MKEPFKHLVVADTCIFTYKGVQSVYQHKEDFKTYYAEDDSYLLNLLKTKERMCVLITDDFIKKYEHVISTIKLMAGDARLIVITHDRFAPFLKRLTTSGVDAVVERGEKIAEFKKAILHTWESKEIYISGTLKPIMQDYDTNVLLSKRETEVFDLIIQEFPNKVIATKLFCSEHTIKQHRKKIKSKLKLGGYKSMRHFMNVNEFAVNEVKIVEKVKEKIEMPREIGRKKVKKTPIKDLKYFKKDASKEDVIDYYENNYEVSEVANHFMISEAQVIKYLKQEGLLTDR